MIEIILRHIFNLEYDFKLIFNSISKFQHHQVNAIQLFKQMKESRHSQNNISIKSECTIFHQNLQLNSKKKSKLSTIQVNTGRNLLVITPNGQKAIYQLQISWLRVVHKKFIDQGKITLEFDGIILKQIDNTAKNNLNNQSNPVLHHLIAQDAQSNKQKYLEGNVQIFINNASKENLDMLTKMLVDAKKNTAKSPKIIKSDSKNENQQALPGSQLEKVQKSRKKPEFISHMQRQQEKVLCRKDIVNMMRLAQNPKPKLKQTNFGDKKDKKKQYTPTITLLSLPKFLLLQIFAYTGISLSYRLISRQLEKLILTNINYLKLQDEIQDETFNKLGKHALKISCRMKNVKNLQLEDRYEQQQLLPNRAKQLQFGNWKQIGAKNINQLKGLRIYSLSVPYSIKFDFSNFYGLRIVQLRLKGSNITNKNSYIKDEQIIYLINNVSDLKVIQVPYGSTRIISQIKNPQKMTMIKIDTLNIIDSPEIWCNLSKFTQLKTFRVNIFMKNGLKQPSHMLDITWPPAIQDIEIGLNLTNSSLNKIPITVINLKIVGEHFHNRIFEQLYLPSMNYLDISEALNITPECLQGLANIKVNTAWDRSKIDYANNYFMEQNIKFASTKCYSPYN